MTKNSMRCGWRIVAFSTAAFVLTLLVPGIVLRKPIPIDVLSAPTLSLHLVAGASCAVEISVGCLLFVATQYALDYVILFSESTAQLREHYEVLVVSWCVAMSTTPLVLLMSCSVLYRYFQSRRGPDAPPREAEEPPAPTGIPIAQYEMHADAVYVSGSRV